MKYLKFGLWKVYSACKHWRVSTLTLVICVVSPYFILLCCQTNEFFEIFHLFVSFLSLYTFPFFPVNSADITCMISSTDCNLGCTTNSLQAEHIRMCEFMSQTLVWISTADAFDCNISRFSMCHKRMNEM